ncbi:MAG TPA: helical backbone metal receptor, partial [Spirochaetales bacterium]|nr:helical backbone metal receptor [Spirochaetales bacterium]
ATGNASSATAVVASIKARLKAVTDKLAKVAEDKRPLVFYEVWDEPLMTAGPGTFIGQVIKAAGGRNVFADLTEDWPMVSFEALVLRKPDIIIASNTHAEALSAQKLAARPGWANLKAVKERRIFLLDGDVLSRPGPRFVEAVELIAKALYPSLF